MGAPLGYDTQPVGPAEMYGGGGRGAGRGDVGGYPAPPSHPLVSSVSEPLGGVIDSGGGRGPFANHGGGPGPAYGNDEYECSDPAPHQQQRLVHWTSDDRGYARQSMATSFAVAETVGAVGRSNGRGW